ncbi:MAG: phosphoenolpyruvate--protein phosphotransferase [Acidimicrobiaceae bacterium]|nr:phosphoenolpyruvate--protein phosphotransferase [Acidimicrobiaceae bacterium]
MNGRAEARLMGTGAAPGVAIGPAVVIDTVEVEIPLTEDPVASFNNAMASVQADLIRLQEHARNAGRTEAAEVLGAQALMAEDPMLADSVAAGVASGATLEEAVTNTSAEIAAMFAAVDDPYIAARATDVEEVTDRVRRRLAGVESTDLRAVEEPSILVAAAITAAETALLDPDAVLGFITEAGGPTSHVAIIARSLGVAAVVGTPGVVGLVSSGDSVALDGTSGEVAIRPNDETAASFTALREASVAAQQAAAQYRGVRVSLGSREVAVPANVGSREDVELAIAEGADGIGLLRTEFLFLDRSTPPSEQEQFEFYSFAAQGFSDAVVIRTFDVGGDKPASYLDVDPEENPFLGVRGARLYSQEPDLFNTQVRAVLRAATHGDVALMLPMISHVDEIREVRAQIAAAAAQLAAEGVDHEVPPIGVMVEVPAVALVADAIADEVDFFSIGTNDLTQYTMAADRTNGALDGFQDPLHPAVLALCKLTADAAHRNQITVSVCGLAAADPVGAVVLAAMGIDKLSVSGRSVNPTKSVVDSLDPATAERLVQPALAAASAAEVREIVRTETTEGSASSVG